MKAVAEDQTREFYITVLGRTLEHLGVQNYKHRDVAIAELVANCWDAGADSVHVEVPDEKEYERTTSRITILDDGEGMSADDVQDQYLVVGRNRRPDDEEDRKRPVMGRKGIGKLAGFGLASRMTVGTWQDGRLTEFTLDVGNLKEERWDGWGRSNRGKARNTTAWQHTVWNDGDTGGSETQKPSRCRQAARGAGAQIQPSRTR